VLRGVAQCTWRARSADVRPQEGCHVESATFSQYQYRWNCLVSPADTKATHLECSCLGYLRRMEGQLNHEAMEPVACLTGGENQGTLCCLGESQHPAFAHHSNCSNTTTKWWNGPGKVIGCSRNST
jgi:hypothetical protein